ncbi:ABC transporter permease [Candidatus Bathyarchaeota archaeon]|nr:ABC transporter permease [Candidatus Bathyarchaeota archaeon]
MSRYYSGIVRNLKTFFRIVSSTKSSLFGFTIVVGYIIMALLGPYIVPLSLVGGTYEKWLPPSLEHPLGTDYLGRDIFAQVVHGAYEVLLLATVVAVFTVIMAVFMGTVAGISGGKIDAALTFITDVMLTIPSFPLLVVIATTFKRPNMFMLGLAMALVSWPSTARAIRSQVLSLKRRDFVEASRCMGISTPFIILYDIMPQIIPYVATSTVLIMLSAIYNLIGLALIGAIPWSEVNWGIMINTATDFCGAPFYTPAMPYLLAPLGATALLQVALIMFSRSLEIIFNPRLRERE